MPALSSCTDDLRQDINVLPLIDVLLVLVIVFFLLQRMLIFIPAQVPPPADVAGAADPERIVLERLADGSWALNTRPVADADLDARLHQVFDARPRKLLYIRVAPERPYLEMVTAMDRARGAGVGVLAWVPAGPPR